MSFEMDVYLVVVLYVCCYDVEFDICDVKVMMDIENICAKSVDMVMKELMGLIIVYNFVVQLCK